MNIFAVTRRSFARLFGTAGPSSPGGWFVNFPPNQAGIRVNEVNALTYSAVWACVKVISESISLLGWKVFAENADGSKEHMARSPANDLLQRSPNPEQSPFVWREQMLGHVLIWGNAYSEIERDGAGRPVALWPITPQRVRMVRADDLSLWYEISAPDGFRSGPALVPARDMLHFKGAGYDGLQGYSVIRLAALSVSLGMAAERFGASFFGNGAHVSGVLKHPGTPSEEARKNMRESWERAYQGVGKAMRTALMYEGMEWQQVGIPPEDAQFLQTRTFQTTEVARWFRVPPHKIADLEKATFSNIEEQSIAFVTDTLLPWASRFEQEADAKLLVQRRQFTRINMNSLLRGNIQSRYGAYVSGRQWGWLSANDVRRLEDMDPIGEEGDIYLSPLNMADAATIPGDASGEPAPAQEPAPAAPLSAASVAAASPAAAALSLPPTPVPTPDPRAVVRTVARHVVARVMARERRKLETVAGSTSMSQVAEKMKGYVEGQAEWLTSALAEVVAVRRALLLLSTGPAPADAAREHCDGLAAWIVESIRSGGITPDRIDQYVEETGRTFEDKLVED